MGLQGLEFKPYPIPFVAGLNTKGNKQAKNPPALEICDDVEFDDVGGVRTRYPMGAAQSSIFGGGTIANARKLVEYGDEKLLFTSTALYSRNDQLSKWVSRGEFLAVKCDEATRFATNGDQQCADRAELNNTIVYAWSEGTSNVYVAAIDKTTGSVLVSPTAIAGYLRPRLVACSTKILLFLAGIAPNGLSVKAIDPADPATGIASAATTVLASANFGDYYDVVRIPGADSAIVGTRRAVTTSYSLHKVTAALAVTSSTKGRTCDGPIAVSCTPDAASVQVVRANGTNIQGDLITISSLADVFTAQAIGTVARTPVFQIAAAHRSVQNGGQYRCYAFWDYDTGASPTGPAEATKSNWVDTGNTLGTQANFAPWTNVASRAFDYNGQVYYWAVFDHYGGFTAVAVASDSPALQGQYLLYRDDGKIFAATTYGNAYFSALTGSLPGVALTSGSTEFTWCGAYRRKLDDTITVNTGFLFAARSPREIVVTFDSDEARRCVKFGETLYIPCAEGLMQYDGVQLTEVGWHIAPYYLTMVSSGSAGAPAAGNYAYKDTLRWENGKGEQDRSSSFNTTTMTAVAAQSIQNTSGPHAIWSTRKTGITKETWRTKVNPGAADPFYLVTSNDPAATDPNGYHTNSLTALTDVSFTDNEADATATLNEENQEVGDVLQSLPFPPATIIAATQNRIFLAGIAGQPNTVIYSMTRTVGQVAKWNDELAFDVPIEGGAITGLALTETGAIIVFRERATYVFGGDGLDNDGAGGNYTLARIASRELGAESMEAIADDDDGTVVKTKRGWYLLDKAFEYHYIGAPVSLYDSETVLAIHVMPGRHQLRILTTARMLVLDTLVTQWGRWTVGDGLHAVLWGNQYAYLTSSGPRLEQSTYTGVDYGFDIEIAWEKLADLHGIGIVRLVQLLGIWLSSHRVRVRIARDYKVDGSGNPSYFYDKTWTPNTSVVGGPERVQFGPSQNRMGAIKVRLTAINIATSGAPDGAACSLTGLVLDAAVEQGVFTNLAAAAKQ